MSHNSKIYNTKYDETTLLSGNTLFHSQLVTLSKRLAEEPDINMTEVNPKKERDTQSTIVVSTT
jgi:hypothetical protein